MSSRIGTLRWLLIFPVLALFAACEESVVFRDRELFETPPDEAAGFLGYSDIDSKLTTCGNCHVGQQARWVQTAHADAWEGLQASGHSQSFCEGCHTVNELGNAVTQLAGFNAAPEDRYHDVQCESCHGPGLTHVQNPDASQPLAYMDADLTATVGCTECHQGTHHPFAEEWQQSKHAEIVASAADNAACTSCHSGEGALKAWGIEVDYIEKDQLGPGNHLAITCAVCHDPHGSVNEGQLRFPVDVASEEENLCMKCHHKRGVPDPTTFRGPHSPEGPTLLGVAGWWPPNLEFPGGSIRATHGSEANPKLCASCHVNSFDVTDPDTGDHVFTATGHLFEAIPCLDANGAPVPGGACDETERTFESCATSGCHGTAEVARGLKFTAEQRIDNLASALEALVAQVPASEFSTTDARYTVGEGARFNAELARASGAAVHNPFLIEALLTASINQVSETYSLAPPAMDLRNLLSISE
ncbi:MAG: cytochrome c3 family protein [Gemmatimonadota bacterium]|nr:hypothetical protein [Gemmatimonadota bacterium]